MSRISLITSGKGGVGKSTVAAALGLTLSLLHRKTVVVEMDVGLRGLDLMFGAEDRTVYDLGNVLRGECSLSDGLVSVGDDEMLSFIAAPVGISSRIDYGDVAEFCRALATYFDEVVIDAPAGIGVSLLLAPQIADLTLVVATPDLISARDAGRLVGMLEERGAKNIRLIINRVNHKKIRRNEIPDLDRVIDMVGAQLIGVVPYCPELAALSQGTDAFLGSVLPMRVFENIASRIMGDRIELLIQ